MQIKSNLKKFAPKLYKKMEKVTVAFRVQGFFAFVFILLTHVFRRTAYKYFFFATYGIKHLFSSGKKRNTTFYPHPLETYPPITIIIPFKDKVKILEICIGSIVQKTKYPSYNILLINNQSVEHDTYSYLKTLRGIKNIQTIEYNQPFNYSALHNWAISYVQTEFVVFLNNDTEVINPEWLHSLTSCVQTNDVGAAGALLLYPDKSVQHAGVVFLKNKPLHVFYGESLEGFHRKQIFTIQEYSAVTGACLMTKKSLYLKVGGMDSEDLKIGLNDFDYCLRLRSKGYRIVYTPEAKLFHHESLSRGNDWTDITKYKRELKESAFFSKKWKGYHDPFLSVKNHLL